MKTFLLPTPPLCVLFDIDNTLYRNDEYVQRQIGGQIERFAKERGLTVTEAERMVDHTRAELERVDGRRPSLANTLVALGVPIETSVTWREEEIEPESYLTRDESVRTMLQTLRSRFRIAALTNNPRSIGMRALHALDIADMFEAVMGIDMARESKPSWKPFELLLEALESDVATVVMIGDRYDVDLEPVIVRGGGAILVENRDDLLSIPNVLEAAYR